MGLEQRFRFPPSKEALRNRLGAVWLGTRARLRPARRASSPLELSLADLVTFDFVSITAASTGMLCPERGFTLSIHGDVVAQLSQLALTSLH